MNKKAPIRDPFDFILPVHNTDYADSTVVGLTGPKRAGKSMLLAKLGVRGLRAGIKVWSTITISIPPYFINRGEEPRTTQEINWDAFFAMSEEYQDGLMLIDEASLYNSNRSPLTSRNRVTNAFTNQIGHRNLDVVWTAKSSQWLDRQGLGFETDIEIVCRDMAKTQFGFAHHIKKGTRIFLSAYDRTGALTGRINNPNDRHSYPFRRWLWAPGDIYHQSYNTRGLVSLEDTFSGVKLDLQKRVISNKEAYNDKAAGAIRKIALQMSKAGEVHADAFWSTVAAAGVQGNPRHLGKYLKEMGVTIRQTTKGRLYDLGVLAGEVKQ